MQKVAKVLKSNGTDGELVISLFDIVPEDLDLQEPVFIFHDGLPVPYFILSSRERGGRLLVRLTGVRSLEDADELAGREVFADYFEDALQYECAKANSCDVITTNNGKDYAEFCDLPFMTAAEFLNGLMNP